MEHIRIIRIMLNRLKRTKRYDADRTNEALSHLRQLQGDIINIHSEYLSLERLIEDLFEVDIEQIKAMNIQQRNKVRADSRDLFK